MTEPRFVDNTNYTTKLAVPDQPWIIFGNLTNFNYFVTTPLAPLSNEDRQYQQGNKKEHQRRQYKGDTITSTVKAHSYGYLHDPGRKVGNAIPGWSFILDDGTERRQFTTTADVVSLVAYLEDQVVRDTHLFTNGARYLLAAVEAGRNVAASS